MRDLEKLDRYRVEVGPERRTEDLQAITAALSQRRQAPRPRRHAIRWTAAAVALLIPTAALAAENTVPGDLLYPVKTAFEPIRMVFDRATAASNRVDELEKVSDQVDDRTFDSRLHEARREVDRIDDETLRRRLDLLETERLDTPPRAVIESPPDSVPSDRPDPGTLTTNPPTTEPVRDIPTETIVPGDRVED